MERAVAAEHHAAFGVADRGEHPAELRGHDEARQQERAEQRDAGGHEERHARPRRGDGIAQDALEIGESIVAAEARVVAEEQQHERVGERLRDDREIDALDPRAECEVAEHEGASTPGTSTTSIAAYQNWSVKLQYHG